VESTIYACQWGVLLFQGHE
jgi:hypothetical protein